jgi:hypothetical protein
MNSQRHAHPGTGGTRRLIIVVRPSAREGVVAAALRCLGRLVPRARLVVAPASPPEDPDAEVITLDADEVAAGPLAAASALARERAATARARPWSS